jgi:hypothetical protein
MHMHMKAWHAGGATWARAAVSSLKTHCSFADLTVASQPAINEKLPPARSCTIAFASTGMGFQVWPIVNERCVFLH